MSDDTTTMADLAWDRAKENTDTIRTLSNRLTNLERLLVEKQILTYDEVDAPLGEAREEFVSTQAEEYPTGVLRLPDIAIPLRKEATDAD